MDTPSKDSIKTEPGPEIPLTVSQLDTQPPFKHEHENAAVEELDLVEVYPSIPKQWAILAALSMAQAIDVMSASALFVILTPTARDLGIAGGDISWM